MDILNRFDTFARALSKKDSIAIIFHTDADGICSAVLAAKAVEKICKKKPAIFLTPAPSEVIISKKMISELKKKKINKVVVVDLNVDQEPESIRAVEKFAEILILDHHTIQSDVNSPRTIMLKPQALSKISQQESSRFACAAHEAFEAPSASKYPASKLAYDMFSRHTNLENSAWLPIIGIYGDMAESEWREFISAELARNKISLDSIKKAGALIIYARSYDEKNGPMKAFREFYSAESISNVLGSRLLEYEDKIEAEISHYIEKRNQLAQFYPEKKLIIYEISPKYNIKSELVNRLSRNFYPEWTCVVIQAKEKTASIGARNQSGKVSMSDLMIRAAAGISDSSGGGHIQAAGASVPNKKKWIKRFKKNILDSC